MTPAERLHCIEGHVAAIRRMVERDEPVPAVMLQFDAVRGALRALARELAEREVRARLESGGVPEAAQVAVELGRMLMGEGLPGRRDSRASPAFRDP